MSVETDTPAGASLRPRGATTGMLLAASHGMALDCSVARLESDEELLVAWQGGDARAGNRLIRRHLRPIRRYLDHQLGPLAEDALQDTLTACCASIARFRGRSTFKTYLYGIALNKVRELRRFHQRQRRLVPMLREPARDDDELVDVLHRRREVASLHHGLQHVSAPIHEALRLYYWDGLTGPAMAERLQVPESTARRRVRRGKQLLAGTMIHAARHGMLGARA